MLLYNIYKYNELKIRTFSESFAKFQALRYHFMHFTDEESKAIEVK